MSTHKQYTFPDVPFLSNNNTNNNNTNNNSNNNLTLSSPYMIPILLPPIQTLQHCPHNEDGEGFWR